MPDDKHHAKPQIDVRTLNLAQLKMLADKGSRRARAELEARMRAMSAGPQRRTSAAFSFFGIRAGHGFFRAFGAAGYAASFIAGQRAAAIASRHASFTSCDTTHACCASGAERAASWA